MSSEKNNLLTPYYQDILIVIVNTVIQRMMYQDFKGAWISLKMLYSSMPKKCKEETEKLFKETEIVLAAIPESTKTFLFETSDIRAKETEYLSVRDWVLYGACINTLDDEGYLLFKSNRPPTRESSMKDLEFTLAKAKFGKAE